MPFLCNHPAKTESTFQTVRAPHSISLRNLFLAMTDPVNMLRRLIATTVVHIIMYGLLCFSAPDPNNSHK